MDILNKLAWLLVVIGALNWLLFALTGSDVGSWVGGMQGSVATVIYILVGLGGVWMIVSKFMGGGSNNMGGGM